MTTHKNPEESNKLNYDTQCTQLNIKLSVSAEVTAVKKSGCLLTAIEKSP